MFPKSVKVVVAVASVAVCSVAVAAETLDLDTGRSKIAFTILNKPPNGKEFSPVEGSFKEFSGKVAFDAKNPAASSLELEIKAASVDTANQRRDDHLRNQDFFKVKEFPVMTFRSTGAKALADGRYEVTGTFTLLGKSREITAVVEKTGELSGKTSFRIKRSDFGMTYRIPETADEVDVTLELVAKPR